MTIDELYKAFDENWSQLVRDLNLGVNVTRKWRKLGYIPWRTQCVIQVETNGRFIARREDDPKEYERWKSRQGYK